MQGPATTKDTEQSRPATASRHRWMDLVRGSAILLVVILHATLLIERVGHEPWPPLVAFSDLFAPFRMPLLMSLSGLLLEQSLRKGWLRHLEGKLLKIAYPYLLWSMVFYLTMYTGPDDHTLWIGASYLWFMLFLLLYHVIAIATFKVSPLAIAVGALVLSAFMPDGSKYYERFFYLMGLFFLGQYAARTPGLLDRMTTSRWALAAAPIALALALLTPDAEAVRYKAELILPTLAGIIIFIWVAKRIAGTPWSWPLEYIGGHSLIFYTIHVPLIYFVMLWCLRQGIQSVVMISLTALLVTLTVGALASALARKNRFAALLFELPPFLNAGSDCAEKEEFRPFTKSNTLSI